MQKLSKTPSPPYYCVIFTSEDGERDESYTQTAQRMMELAAQQEGFLGVDSLHENSLGITVSYWRNEAAIQAWRENSEHLFAQRQGRERWYRRFILRVAKVERAYEFEQA